MSTEESKSLLERLRDLAIDHNVEVEVSGKHEPNVLLFKFADCQGACTINGLHNVRSTWYAHQYRLNPEVFDYVNASHGKRGTIDASSPEDALRRLPEVFAAIQSGHAYIN